MPLKPRLICHMLPHVLVGTNSFRHKSDVCVFVLCQNCVSLRIAISVAQSIAVSFVSFGMCDTYT